MSSPIDMDPRDLQVTRRAPGGYMAGTWKAGRETALNIVASVQPTDPKTLLLLPEGKRSKVAFTVYTETRLTVLDDTTGQPSDLLWIDGRPHEISLSWDNVARSSELAYFKAVATRVNTVSGPSDYALAGELIPSADLPVCFRASVGDGKLYLVTDTGEDAEGYAGPSRSGGAPGEVVTFTLAGNVHSSITGTAGTELYAFNGAYISDLSDVAADEWTVSAGTIGANGLNVRKGLPQLGSSAKAELTEAFTAEADQAIFTVSSPVASVSVVTVGGGENRYPVTGAVEFTIGSSDVTMSESIPAGLSVVIVYIPF